MLHAFYALKGKYADKRKLAEDAIILERERCKESGGWQDQIAAAYGGLNRIDFGDNSFKVSPIIIHPDRKKLLNAVLFGDTERYYQPAARQDQTVEGTTEPGE